MTVCNFFLQGRCRYGDKCWNEHPRGGGYSNNYSRSSQQQQQPRGGGGFGNRVWVNPANQKGRTYIQPSSFAHDDDWGRGGGADWGRGGGGGGGGADWGGGGGGGRRDNVKSSEFSFSQNRFSALNSPSTFDKGGRGGGTVIQADIEIWESSGQWGFSCYSCTKTPVSGFTDLSPEELRLEYYTTRASGDLQNYINGVNQLLNQWRNRIQELKIMNATTRAALLAELSNPTPQGSSSDFGGSGSHTFGFGSKGEDEISLASAQPPSGFGSSSSNSASTFSFAASNASKPPTASAFGSASEFSFSSSTGGGFGTGFGTEAAATSGGSGVSGQTSGGFGPTPVASASGTSDSLFSTKSSLTPEELDQFKAKRFTLGQIPLKPPPADMLIV
uniref:Nucleoporin NUP42 n=1 Tax=Sphaeramia orbicularis TaxID=375764 RepID=A0A673BNS8_9TELE